MKRRKENDGERTSAEGMNAEYVDRVRTFDRTWCSNEQKYMSADWSAHSVGSGFPFLRVSTERRVEVACPKAAHTALEGSG